MTPLEDQMAHDQLTYNLIHRTARALQGPAYGRAAKRKARLAIVAVLETVAAHYGTDYINGGDLQDVATGIRKMDAS